jgi:hypothetical protein
MLCHFTKVDPDAHRISAKNVVEPLQYSQAASYVRNVIYDIFGSLLSSTPGASWVDHARQQTILAHPPLVSLRFDEQEMPVVLKLL